MAYKQKNNPFNSSGSPIKQEGTTSDTLTIKDWDGPKIIGSSGPFGVIGGGGLKIAKGIYSAIKNPQKIKQIAGAFANTAKQYAKKGFGKAKPKGSFTKDPYTRHRTKLMKEGMSKTEVFKRFPTKDMMTPQQLSNIAKAAGKSKPTSNFKPLVTGNKVYDKKSINKAFEQRFGKPKTSKPSKPSKPNTVEGSNITYNIERPSLKSQGMSTPLTPKMNPKNPRGHESITLKGGRKMTKPGTPGHSRGLGGKKTYSAKDPLWPEKIDRVLYPKNWM